MISSGSIPESGATESMHFPPLSFRCSYFVLIETYNLHLFRCKSLRKTPKSKINYNISRCSFYLVQSFISPFSTQKYVLLVLHPMQFFGTTAFIKSASVLDPGFPSKLLITSAPCQYRYFLRGFHVCINNNNYLIKLAEHQQQHCQKYAHFRNMKCKKKKKKPVLESMKYAYLPLTMNPISFR